MLFDQCIVIWSRCVGKSGGLPDTSTDSFVKNCSCATQGTKRRVWEASVSSLKSKKVKGAHSLGSSDTDSFWSLGSKSYKNDTCHECSMGTSKDKLLPGVAPECLSNGTDGVKDTGNCTTVYCLPEVTAGTEICLRRECFSIMLMNIADDNKKVHLTKVHLVFTIYG